MKKCKLCWTYFGFAFADLSPREWNGVFRNSKPSLNIFNLFKIKAPQFISLGFHCSSIIHPVFFLQQIPYPFSVFIDSQGQPRKPRLKMAMSMAIATDCGSSRWSMASLKSALPRLTSTASSIKLPCRRRAPPPVKSPQLVRSFTALYPVNPLHSLGFSGNFAYWIIERICWKMLC